LTDEQAQQFYIGSISFQPSGDCIEIISFLSCFS
jgi:hypothetical protein